MAIMPVVVGVDGSEESLLAAEWGALEAVRHHAPLRIVSAPPTPPRLLDNPAVTRDLRAMSLRTLTEVVARCGEIAPHLLIEASLLDGSTAPAVTASGSSALLLVVGARGGGGFASLPLGSVSRYAAEHAPCPVVVARTETSAVRQEVAAGVRDPDDAAHVLGFAFEEAVLRHADLVVVHSVYWSPEALSNASGRHPDSSLATADGRLAAVLSGWQDKYPGVTVRWDVVATHPAKVLASYSARADLVVIGRRESDGAEPVIGGTRHALLYHARGPVAVVPAEAF